MGACLRYMYVHTYYRLSAISIFTYVCTYAAMVGDDCRYYRIEYGLPFAQRRMGINAKRYDA